MERTRTRTTRGRRSSRLKVNAIADGVAVEEGGDVNVLTPSSRCVTYVRTATVVMQLACYVSRRSCTLLSVASLKRPIIRRLFAACVRTLIPHRVHARICIW